MKKVMTIMAAAAVMTFVACKSGENKEGADSTKADGKEAVDSVKAPAADTSAAAKDTAK